MSFIFEKKKHNLKKMHTASREANDSVVPLICLIFTPLKKLVTLIIYFYLLDMKDRLCFGKMCLKLEALEVAKIPISPLKLLAVQVEVGKPVISLAFQQFRQLLYKFFSIYDDFRILGFIYFVT